MSTFGRSFRLKLLCLSKNSRRGLYMGGYVIVHTSLQPWTQGATSSCSQSNSSVCTASGIKLCGSWKWLGGRHWPGEDVVQSYPCCGNWCMYGHWLPALQARLLCTQSSICVVKHLLNASCQDTVKVAVFFYRQRLPTGILSPVLCLSCTSLSSSLDSHLLVRDRYSLGL